MELHATRQGQTVTVRLTGELDHHAATGLKSDLDALILDPGVRQLCLDLQDVGFMDSAGLGVVLGRYRLLTERGGSLSVTGVPDSVDRIFKMSGLYSLVSRV
ncbi:MAG: anti-sigma factor antagonist [Eubacteriales bacterium]|nr:anti-sigma factor antagonist [Eubacteriales bacterium]